jgi:type IV conjugative transfer system coupling protein TraD
MRLQNFKIVFLLSLIFASIGLGVSIWWYNLTTWHWYNFFIQGWVLSQIKVFLAFLTNALGLTKGATPTITIIIPGQGHIRTTAEKFLNSSWTLHHLQPIIKCFWASLGAWMAGVTLLYTFFKYKSKKLEEKQITRGKTFEEPKIVAKLVKKNGKPNFYITPELPLPKDSENQHMAVLGTTRMGKTNYLLNHLQQIRERGERAIILDVTGEMASVFFRPDKDKLLNPLDVRSECWDVWSEGLSEHEYDAWSASMVPEGHGDPIWHQTARNLLAYTALTLADDPTKSMPGILEKSCWSPLDEELMVFYADSPVSAIMRPSAEKTASGVRMHLANSINAMRYLTSDKEPFSITQWIAQKETDQWLFLTSLPNQRSTLAPLLASWFNFAFLGLERAGVDFTNRLWFFLDELPGLDFPITSLKRIVAEGAKYGACCVVGLQNTSQIDKLYGSSVRKTILSCCSTKLIFKTPDPETAKNLSDALGEQEILHSLENFSIGASHFRDGVSLASQQLRQAVVTPTEIMSLNKLTAFVILSGQYPITKVTFEQTPVKANQPNFIPISMNTSIRKEMA